METAQAGAAFISKQVDAAVVFEPWLTKAREQGGGHILASTREFPDLIVDCLAFNKRIMNERPGDVQTIVNVVLRSIRYVRQNPTESYRIMAPHFQVDAGKYADIVSGLKFTDLARNQSYFGTGQRGPIFEVARTASDIWLRAKMITREVDPTSIISTQFVGTAREQ